MEVSSPGSWATKVSDKCMSLRGEFFPVIHVSHSTGKINFPTSIWNWCNKRTGGNEFEARQLRRSFRRRTVDPLRPYR